ncbi:hypothetical protein XHV734_3778 [Xanthomonas hortorum pv. vitians]|nr:hypothetical protein XHV734_3778 [Xanthomonas hortorum pv. vitians]
MTKRTGGLTPERGRALPAEPPQARRDLQGKEVPRESHGSLAAARPRPTLRECSENRA